MTFKEFIKPTWGKPISTAIPILFVTVMYLQRTLGGGNLPKIEAYLYPILTAPHYILLPIESKISDLIMIIIIIAYIYALVCTIFFVVNKIKPKIEK